MNVSAPNSNGKSSVRCTHKDCPLNWVTQYRSRSVLGSTATLVPLDYEIQRWGLLPQLIAEIENLVARTEYDNHGNAVFLHDSAESARQAREEVKRQEDTRQQAIEALQSGEQLTVEQKKEIASLAARSGFVTCRCKKVDSGWGCGSDRVCFQQLTSAGNPQFRCGDCMKRNGEKKILLSHLHLKNCSIC